MISSLYPQLGLASIFIPFATASPFHSNHQPSSLEVRQNKACTDIRAEPNADCWDHLDIPGYLNDPTKGWIATTPKCSPDGGDQSNCCTSTEPWSTCFLRLARGTPGADCSTINQQSCTLDNQLDPRLDPSIVVKVGYVVRSIESIGNLFINYYSGESRMVDRVEFDVIVDYGIPASQYHQGFNDLSTTLDATAKIDMDNLNKAMIASLPFWGVSSLFIQQMKPIR